MSNWLIYGLGLVAQGLFSARILVQWFMSERAKKVVSPTIFWVLSLIASYIFFVYGWLRKDFAIMLGQIIGYYVYIWNLGAKGVWGKISSIWRWLVISILLMTPIVGITIVISKDPTIFETLFQNSSVPLWLVIYGSLGQVIFSFRFIYQLIYSYRRGESILPIGFWIISLIGSATIISYGIVRRDPVLILGQSAGFISYTRNLILWKREKRLKDTSCTS